MKIDIQKVDLTNTNQKIFAAVLIGIVLMIFWVLLPPLVVIFKNLWLLLIMGLPLMYIIMNPMLFWTLFKQLSWNLTKWIVSKDKLGFMYKYHEYLITKIDRLDGSIKTVSTMRVKVQRKIAELQNTIEENKSRAVALQQQKVSELVLRTMGNKINIDQKQKDTLLPKVVNIESQEKYLKELYNAWLADAEDLKYTLDAKAQEYQLLKEMSEATGNAQEFLKGNSEEYKLYQESLKQIEDSVTQYTANIEDFERKVQPILETISANRTVSENDGLKLIEEYKKTRVDLKIE